MRLIIGLLLCFGLFPARAEAQAPKEKDALISWVLERFWGHARDSKGAVIQPASDLDRHTVPVPTAVAYRAIDAGEVSGLAEWCGLDWKSHYLSLTSAARRRGMSDTQVAFISVLHGLTQESTRAAKTSPCVDGDRSQVAEKLKVSREMGLGALDT
jgi:hypothetical protein